MVVCNRCGSEVHGNTFCSECGASLVNASFDVTNKKIQTMDTESQTSPIPSQGDSSDSMYSGEVPSQVGNAASTREIYESMPNPSNQIIFAVTLLIVEIICCCCGGFIAAIFAGIALHYAHKVEMTSDRDKAKDFIEKAKTLNLVSLFVFVFCLLAVIAAAVLSLYLK